MNNKKRTLNDLVDEMKEVTGHQPAMICPDDLEPGDGILIDGENDLTVICGVNAFFEKTYDDLIDAMIGLIIDLMTKSYRKGLEENLSECKDQLKEAFEKELGKLKL